MLIALATLQKVLALRVIRPAETNKGRHPRRPLHVAGLIALGYLEKMRDGMSRNLKEVCSGG